MPLYDYRCEGCGATYDRLQKLGAPKSHDCEVCGEGTARRQLSTPNFRVSAGAGNVPRRVDTSTLPVVGRDGRLYSADGKTVLAG